MHEEWTDQLSEYLDGELSPAETAAVDAHLRECPACAEVLNDLKRVVARARTLEVRPPQAELWPGVAARTERIAQPRRVSFTLPQLAAAAVLLMAISGAVVWQLAGRVNSSAPTNATAAVAAPVDCSLAPEAAPAIERGGADAVPVSFADAQYDAAVAESRARVEERARPARQGHDRHRRAQPADHRSGDRAGARRARRRPREHVSERSPRRGTAPQAGSPPPRRGIGGK